MNNPAIGADADSYPGRPDAVRAPLLSSLLDAGDPPRRRVVADLGALQPGLLEAVSGTRTKLLIVDLPERRRAGTDHWEHIDSALPTGHWRVPVDAVLCWDLLNYLDVERLAGLAASLRDRAAPACRVHALIHYSALEMPEQPAGIRIDSDRALQIPNDALQSRVAAPRYSPKALEKAMPSLTVDRSMLLGNGMREFLFKLRVSG
jgi:hypothetical protein